MACIDFYNLNLNPITCFKSNFQEQNKRYKKPQNHPARVKLADFIEEDHIESVQLTKELNIGSVMLSKLMLEIGFERIHAGEKKWYTLKAVIDLKESGLLDEKPKSKMDVDSMISTSELSEIYNCKSWELHKVVEASYLKPIMRKSGKVYFYKNDIIPFFESFKNKTLKYKPRTRKKI